jgi:hypothetical protein
MVDINARFKKKNTQTKLQGDKSGERALYYKLPLIEVRLQFFVLSPSRFVWNHGLNVVTHVTIDFWFGTRPNITEGLRSQKISLKSRPRRQTQAYHPSNAWWQGREQILKTTASEWDHFRPITTPTVWIARISKKEVMLSHPVQCKSRCCWSPLITLGVKTQLTLNLNKVQIVDARTMTDCWQMTWPFKMNFLHNFFFVSYSMF